MVLAPLIPSSLVRPKSEALQVSLSQKIGLLVSRSFSITTILLTGATIQGAFVLLVPRVWMLAPTLLLLFLRFANTLAITFGFRPNPYLDGAIFKRTTVSIPDKDGNMSDEPAEESIAILELCLKVNHPMGMFAPNVKEVGDFAEEMAIELDASAPQNGFLGQSGWHSVDPKGCPQIMLLSYWRSIEHVHNYSQSPLHMKAVQWWESKVHKNVDGMKHVGIDHELFEASRSKWEKISVNFQPTRLGATSYLRKGDKLLGGIVEDQWISPVIEAKGKFKTSRGRLKWSDNGVRVGSLTYEEK